MEKFTQPVESDITVVFTSNDDLPETAEYKSLTLDTNSPTGAMYVYVDENGDKYYEIASIDPTSVVYG